MATGPVTTVDHATTEKLLGNGTPPAQASSSAQNPAAGTSVRSDPSFVPHPMFHRPTMHSVDIEDYFRGPRDVHRHSKWPVSMRLHGSILPKMIVPLSLVAAWATLIVCISQLVQTLEVNSVLLTVTGFVVSLSLSFRSTTAYERFTEGRKYWSQLLLNSRNLARLIWVHVEERHSKDPALGKRDLLAKLAALQLINAFAVALKHRLRFEPAISYPDLGPLLSNLHTLAGDADQASLQHRHTSKIKSLGQYLGVPMAESNPRKLLKRSKENLGNTPLEIITYLSAYLEGVFQNKTLSIGVHQGQVMTSLFNLNDVLSGCERVVNTPLPVAYSISIAQITYAYVIALPFQLVTYLKWAAIPGTIIAGYIILGLAQIGRELENPFGQDVNDLFLDSFCTEIANDIDALTSRPAQLDEEKWLREAGARPLWPLSNMDYKAWQSRSVEEIRIALRAKAESRDVKHDRIQTFVDSGTLTTPHMA